MASRDTIELLRREIQEFRIPPPYTEAEQQKIMAGRKGQAEIDAGREAINKRAEEHRKAKERRAQLINRLAELEAQASQTETEAQREAEAGSWAGAAKQYGPTLGGIAAGAAYGAVANRRLNEFERRNTDNIKSIAAGLPAPKNWQSRLGRAQARGAAQAAEKYAPTGAMSRIGGPIMRGGAYGVPAAALLYEAQQYRNQAADENLTDAERESARMRANFLLGMGGGILTEGGMRFLIPGRQADEGGALAKINAAREYANDMDRRETPEPSKRKRPEKTQRAPFTARETQDAKRYLADRGVHTKGMTPRRIVNRANRMLSRGLSVGLPVAIGAYAADAAMSDAEARGLSDGEQNANALASGVAAGGGAYAGMRGLNALGQAVTRYAPGVARMASRAFPALTAVQLGAMGINALQNPPQVQGRMPETPGNPDFFRQQNRLAEIGGRQPPRGVNPLGLDPEFAAALQEFEALLQQDGALGNF